VAADRPGSAGARGAGEKVAFRCVQCMKAQKENDLKTSLTLMILAFLVLPLGAQPLDFGLKGGVNFASQTNPQVVPADYRMRMDFVAGVYVAFRLSDRLALQPEVLLSREGVNTSDSYYVEMVENQWKVDYLKVPLLLRYHLVQKANMSWSILLGPYLSYRIKASRTQSGFGFTEVDETTERVWPGDYGLILGGVVETPMAGGRLTLDIRFNLGLANTIYKGGYNEWVTPPDDPSASRNRVLSVMLGYGF